MNNKNKKIHNKNMKICLIKYLNLFKKDLDKVFQIILKMLCLSVMVKDKDTTTYMIFKNIFIIIYKLYLHNNYLINFINIYRLDMVKK